MARVAVGLERAAGWMAVCWAGAWGDRAALEAAMTEVAVAAEAGMERVGVTKAEGAVVAAQAVALGAAPEVVAQVWVRVETQVAAVSDQGSWVEGSVEGRTAA